MSPVAKAVVERTLMAMHAANDELLKASQPWREEALRHFGLDPEAPANPLHAGQWPSPAVRQFIDREIPFEIDGDFFTIVRVAPSRSDPQCDVLLLEGYEHVEGDERATRRTLQLRDLEALIMTDRVNIPFVATARQYNLNRGWANGGRTMASLGIVFGQAAP